MTRIQLRKKQSKQSNKKNLRIILVKDPKTSSQRYYDVYPGRYQAHKRALRPLHQLVKPIDIDELPDLFIHVDIEDPSLTTEINTATSADDTEE